MDAMAIEVPVQALKGLKPWWPAPIVLEGQA